MGKSVGEEEDKEIEDHIMDQSSTDTVPILIMHHISYELSIELATIVI